jgi:hypothetical protein
MFVSTVVVSGVEFEGEPRRTKKASEQTAAYTALGNLQLDSRALGHDPSAQLQWDFS